MTLDNQPERETPLIDELKQLGGEARTYAEAEFAYQKARAVTLGNALRRIAMLGVAALIVAIFALVALVAGLLIGLSGLVGPWWATAIVAGGLAVFAMLSILLAKAHWRRMKRRLFVEDKAP